MASTSQSQSLHKILATKLTVSIPVPSHPNPTAVRTPSSLDTDEFDFSDVFGPSHPKLTPSPSCRSPLLGEPPVIYSRSHSFVGPSPRFTITTPSSSFNPHNYPFLQTHKEIASQISEDDEVDEDSEDICGEVKVVTESEKSKLGPDDFEILRVIGKGAFGKVFQVRKTGGETAEDGILAMKVMRKDNIIKKNHVEYMKAERDILTKVVHPFIIQLRYSFQTKSKLYLIFDFINGGHLFYHLYRQGIFSEDQARLYTAEIVSAVSHLHKNGIVHRDLKPENILMDAEGHVVLTDFGLAKEIDVLTRSNSFCGTVEYMAPEILQSKGHNKEADWWSVGILLYEMLSGQVPFTHANRKKLQQRIINEKVKLPPFLTTEAHSLLKGLLQKDPSKRLGSSPCGADEIKSHSWFRSINWKKLELKDIQPKFKPDVGGKDCTANFDQCWTTMPPNDSPAPTPTGAECFQGYTYVAANAWLSSG